MTLKQALTNARRILESHHIEDFALESEILLRHVLNIGHVQMLLDLDSILSPEQEKLFNDLIERRARGEPTAYIIGHREFFGIDYYVNHDVLIPRPETELLVEKTIELIQAQQVLMHPLGKIPLNPPLPKGETCPFCKGRYRGISSVSKGEVSKPLGIHPNKSLTIADIGTGSGAIAIALALNLPGVRIYATDISEQALEVARANCQRHGVSDRVTLLQGDMLAPLTKPIDLIIANLPYVPEGELTSGSPLSFEPALALNGGADGLDKIRQFIEELKKNPALTRYLLLEIGQGQKDSVIKLLLESFPSASIETAFDLGGIERVIVLTLSGVNDKLTTASRYSKDLR